MTRFQKTLLILIVVCGALLRYGGLSHDLHEQRLYHPDTPKQVRAVQSYLDGKYFSHIGNRDYDGYPLFNAHLVEYVCRAIEPLRKGALHLLGVPGSADATSNIFFLYWITLLFNATLSALAVVVVYRIGRENFTPWIALWAAAFQAVSPVDVTACHYATGDSTTAFFTALSLFYAFRIYRLGRRRDYMLAAVTAVFGFAAKYHGGMAVFPIIVAHIARTGGPSKWFRRESLGRAGWTAAAGIAALFAAIPSLLTHFDVAFADVLAALRNTASRVPPELKDAGRLAKFVFSMKTNLPILFQILGPALTLGAVIALLGRFRARATVPMLLSLPVMYFITGVGSRTLVHPTYHAVMVPPLCVLAAACFARKLNPEFRWKLPVYAMSGALLVGGLVFLARGAWTEAFFQWHMDTRRMGAAWTAENTPPSFAVDRGRYTFNVPRPDGISTAGVVRVRGRFDVEPALHGTFLLKKFRLEDKPLMQFRNPGIVVSAGHTDLLREGFGMPVLQRWPSRNGNQFAFDNGVTFYRDDKLLDADADEDAARWIVSESPIANPVVIIRNGGLPNFVTAAFAGQERTFHLEPGRCAVAPVDEPKPAFPGTRGPFFYRFTVRASNGPARALIATRADETGAALFNLGRWADAAPWLEQAAVEEKNPTLAVAALASRVAAAEPASGSDALAGEAARILQAADTAGLAAVYGISPEYLKPLPFVTVRGEDMVLRGFKKGRRKPGPAPDLELDQDDLVPAPIKLSTDKHKERSASTPPLMLDPGCYVCTVRMSFLPGEGAKPSVQMDLAEVSGTVVSGQTLDVSAAAMGRTVEQRVPLFVPWNTPAVKIVFRPAGLSAFTVELVRIQPDPVAGVEALKTVYRLIKDDAVEAASHEPFAYEFLMAGGAALERNGRTAEAFERYEAALQARPNAARPLERLEAMKAGLAPDQWRRVKAQVEAFAAVRGRGAGCRTDTVFRNGVRITRVALRETVVKPGGSIGFNAYATLDKPFEGVEGTVVWVHLVAPDGKIVAQIDHDLAGDLMLRPDADSNPPYFREFTLSPGLPPGEYAIRMGLYVPSERRRFAIASSALPHKQASLTLPIALRVTQD